jgi:hypothetical protein
MDVHLCRCSSGPHADAPTMDTIDAAQVLVVSDPNSQVNMADVGRALGAWVGQHGVHVVVLHDGITLQSLTAEQLASIGLQRVPAE